MWHHSCIVYSCDVKCMSTFHTSVLVYFQRSNLTSWPVLCTLCCCILSTRTCSHYNPLLICMSPLLLLPLIILLPHVYISFLDHWPEIPSLTHTVFVHLHVHVTAEYKVCIILHLSFFLNPGGHTDLVVEAALSKCRRLITWCTTYNYPSTSSSSSSSPTPPLPSSGAAAITKHSSSVTVMAYATVLDAILSKVHLAVTGRKETLFLSISYHFTSIIYDSQLWQSTLIFIIIHPSFHNPPRTYKYTWIYYSFLPASATCMYVL